MIAQEEKIARNKKPDIKEEKKFDEIDVIDKMYYACLFVNDKLLKKNYVCSYIKLVQDVYGGKNLEIDLKG